MLLTDGEKLDTGIFMFFYYECNTFFPLKYVFFHMCRLFFFQM